MSWYDDDGHYHNVSVPVGDSKGEHYHAAGTPCGLHTTRSVSMTTEELAATGLSACSNCVQHHGMTETWALVEQARRDA